MHLSFEKNNNLSLKGFITALFTPFKNNRVDEEAFTTLIAHQMKHSIQGLTLLGTTAESATLTDSEQKHLVDLALETTEKRIPLIIGTGTHSTSTTLEKTLYAQEKGAQAALVVVPYYVKPTQEGLYRHFKTIHDETRIPLILYSVPSRTGADFSFETLLKLSALERVVAIKDASGDMIRPLKSSLFIHKPFSYLTGNDDTLLPYMAQGGHGCISVTSNLVPKLCCDLYEAWQARDITKAQALNQRLQPLQEALFIETNPGPLKYAASLLGFCSPDVRSPLALPTSSTQGLIQKALENLQLI